MRISLGVAAACLPSSASFFRWIWLAIVFGAQGLHSLLHAGLEDLYEVHFSAAHVDTLEQYRKILTRHMCRQTPFFAIHYFEVFHFLESTHAVGPKDSVVYRTFEIGRTRQHHLHRHVLMSANALLRCVKELASAKESEGNRCGTCEGAGWEEP